MPIQALLFDLDETLIPEEVAVSTSGECMALGIASWEGLHARFEGDSPLLKALRKLTPGYRAQAWKLTLAEHGVRDEALLKSAGDQADIDNRLGLRYNSPIEFDN